MEVPLHGFGRSGWWWLWCVYSEAGVDDLS